MKFSTIISSLKSRHSSIYSQVRQHWQDTLIVIVLAVVAGVVCYQGAQIISPAIINKNTLNLWFGADCPRVFGDMAIYDAPHYRTSVHPLFVLLTFPPVYVLKKALSIESLTAVRLFIAIVSCLWISTLFILLRLITLRRLDATLFSILGAVSAAAIFWFVIPETYSVGSLSILLALCFVALTQHQQFSWLWYVAINALTLSFTVTNWMVGLFATLVNHRRKRFLQIALTALFLVGVLALVQKVFFPTAGLKNMVDQSGEMQYLFSPESGGPLQVVKSFVAHTLVMPAIQVVKSNEPDSMNLLVMLTQNSRPGSGTLWGAVAVVLWIALLGLGLWSLFSVKEHLKLRMVLGLSLVGQLILHALYGSETFLYSLHFAPLLVVLAALSTLTQARSLALVLASILIVSTGINNGLQFNKAREHINLYDRARSGPLRQEVRSQMQQRPPELWFHNTRQVVLTAPGICQLDQTTSPANERFSCIENEKSYL